VLPKLFLEEVPIRAEKMGSFRGQKCAKIVSKTAKLLGGFLEEG
jgi:hypothetical protein